LYIMVIVTRREDENEKYSIFTCDVL
jgi:hypothetical protein